MKLLNEILGTKYTIIQGGMANIATGEFAAACSNAGALGVIASGSLRSGEELRKQIEICRFKTDRPFGVNLMLMNPSAPEMAQVIAQERVPVVTTGAGNPAHYIPAWKEAGVKVFPVVAASILARRLVQAGADAIIAEGKENCLAEAKAWAPGGGCSECPGHCSRWHCRWPPNGGGPGPGSLRRSGGHLPSGESGVSHS